MNHEPHGTHEATGHSNDDRSYPPVDHDDDRQLACVHHHTDTDVVIAAVSLARLVEWCGTPCVHTADAVVPHTDGHVSETETASVVIARVISAEWRSDLRLHVTIDADLTGCTPTLSETRLIGRPTTASPSTVTLEAAATARYGYACYLPSDIATGDLVVVPCIGTTSLHDVKAGNTGS